MKQLKRQVQLIIGDDKKSVVIQDIKIDFDITKTITQDPNKATVVVTNLNGETRNLISSGAYDRVELRVGYSDLRTLFFGHIDLVENKKTGVDIETILTCNDGQDDYRNSIISLSLASGSTDNDLINHAVASMKNTQRGSITTIGKRKLPRGKVVHGHARKVLADLAKNHDADWSIQDGNLLFMPKSHALANNEGFLISEATGMIGSPQRTNIGLEVHCFVNNVMRVGQLCRVVSALKEYNGDYKIVKIQSKGSNRSNDFTNILGLQNGNFQEVKK